MSIVPDSPETRAQLRLWWIIWAAMLPSVILLEVLLPRGKIDPITHTADLMVQLCGVVPLFVSIVIRWLILPRFTSLSRALPMFIVGLATAEACGILGIVFGGPYRDAIFTLSILGIVQFVPLFARQLIEPKGSGFIPNR